MTALLARFAFACPRPLIVVAPGATAERLSAERVLRTRGGVPAMSAADADTLLVCGAPSASLGEIVDRLWEQLPMPRARVSVLDAADAGAALDEAVDALVDIDGQRAGAGAHTADRGVRARMTPADGGGDQHDGGGHDDHDHGGGDNQDESGDDEESGGEEEMMPAGLPMAEQAPDRDGLKLDRLHLELGPVLPDWPAGLVLRIAVQGDVVQEAEVRTLPAASGAHAGPSFWDAPAAAAAAGEPVDPAVVAARMAAAHLDSVARLLGVAGWNRAAVRARRLRDELLAGRVDRVGVERFARRVRRSRTLRWLLDGLGVLDHDEALARGVEGPALRAGGDVRARLWQWLAEAESALAGAPVAGEGPRGPLEGAPASAALLEVLPELVCGLDVAGARLVVASLDPDLDQFAGARAGVMARG